MSFNTIIKRASSFLGFSGPDYCHNAYSDGDIIYCKNNVCVHTPSQYRGEGSSIHHPGYMVVKCLCITPEDKSLTLSWIPNDRLKRNHDLVYNISNDNSLNSLGSESEIYSVPELKTNFEQEFESEENVDTTNKQPLLNSLETAENCEPDSGLSSNTASSLCTITSGCSNRNSPEIESANEEKKEPLVSNTSGVCSSDEVSELSSSAKQNPENCVSCIENNDKEGVLHRCDEVPESHIEGVKNQDPQSLSEMKENVQQNIKARYVSSSSSDSSCDNGKPSTAINENSESSFHVESNSDDEISMSSSDLQSSPPPCYFSSKARDQWYDRSAESMAYCANLAFPDSPSGIVSLCPTPVEGGSSPVRRHHKCGIFSVDLGLMKSLRLFFNDTDKTCGQLVIASQESQYKILHFHHGGLDKLASVFEDWNFLISPKKTRLKDRSPTSSTLKQFSVCRPQIKKAELHPEEGRNSYLDADTWVTYFSEDGQIEDDLSLRRTIFFGGVEPQLRTNVWPFLLHYYDLRTTFGDREMIMQEKHQMYQRIDLSRRSLSGEEKERFWKTVQCTVEKDVVRTDRSNPCFAGADNPYLSKMKDILLNFAYYNPEIGYTQGMSDIVAPILAEVRNEADVFWCFTGMMSKTIFVTSPRDYDMEKNLSYLRELLKLTVHSFYDYISLQEDGLDLLFCHRWILLCFKREFVESEALTMWEACWSNYQTDYFHLFLVVSIVAIYGSDVVQQKMRPDETLLYFTSLGYHMDGELVLKKARGLLHQFRSQSSIPCTLVGLCDLCGPGMWDSGHAPAVVCTGHCHGPIPCLVAQSTSTPIQE